jgi:ABC-type glutathione transport system ATPase component
LVAASRGEQQRAAIATALANRPKLLLADEPTGELDSSTAQDVFSALRTANSELGVTMLVVTHDPAVSSQVRRTIAIRDGKTSTETIRHAATDERGQTTLHAREYATLDRAGRVQLPREMIRRIGIRNRVELQEEPDHIGVWPDQAADQDGSNRRTLTGLPDLYTQLAASGPVWWAIRRAEHPSSTIRGQAATRLASRPGIPLLTWTDSCAG